MNVLWVALGAALVASSAPTAPSLSIVPAKVMAAGRAAATLAALLKKAAHRGHNCGADSYLVWLGVTTQLAITPIKVGVTKWLTR